jgi:hypothetical protein
MKPRKDRKNKKSKKPTIPTPRKQSAPEQREAIRKWTNAHSRPPQTAAEKRQALKKYKWE